MKDNLLILWKLTRNAYDKDATFDRFKDSCKNSYLDYYGKKIANNQAPMSYENWLWLQVKYLQY